MNDQAFIKALQVKNRSRFVISSLQRGLQNCLLLGVGALLPLVSVQVAAEPARPPAFACAFLDPVYFGASISAGYGNLLDGAAAAFRDAAFHDDFYGTNFNPAEDLQKTLFGLADPLNVSEMHGAANKFHADGAKQIKALLSTDAGEKRYQRTTLMASLDAFYWPSVMYKCPVVLKEVDTIIDLAQKNHKPLLLGNLPLERADQVDWILKWHGWTAPPKSCVAQVNAKLAQRCDPKKQCYVVDLFRMVKDLNQGKIVFNGTRLRVQDVRSDGIHLTDTGKAYIEKLIAKELRANPPACVADEVAQRRSLQAYRKNRLNENVVPFVGPAAQVR